MKEKELQFLKDELLKMKKEYETALSDNEKTKEDAADTEELSNTGNHPGDQGTELFERQKNLTLDQHASAKLDEVKEALEAIEEGNYGTCDECGREIPFERLEIMPETKYCVDHAEDKNRTQDRPAEEDVTSPLNDKNTSDKEEMRQEAWETARDHGTSNTPADYEDPEDY
ncbi:TraR/DksA C4-type zinc finger protein [Salipaludibacillus aurantiacus]|uniref:Regulatory protein, yteA family n=1 Tax=Salipaludibacillus aurantiacus TaxID=1601833 RepID=A0A1H9XAG2_9BACI|nr:TraR/DksA C4-type zinc finger protein [Salipaludibacillus aurantiacus]SES43041.1 regulatory protein, yteA family [Salipaludibacillus aurantiacus]